MDYLRLISYGYVTLVFNGGYIECGNFTHLNSDLIHHFFEQSGINADFLSL